MGEISRWGDGMVRIYLLEAATVLLRRVKRWSSLKAWAVRLAQRAGATKGPRGAGPEACRGHARDLAQRRAVPLDRRAAGSLTGQEEAGQE